MTRRILIAVAALALALPGSAAAADQYVPFVTDFPQPAERYEPFVTDFPTPTPAADPKPEPSGVTWDAVPAEGVAATVAAALGLALLAGTRRRHAGPRPSGT